MEQETAAALAALAERCRGCTACPLCRGRRQAVFGVGNPAARLLFVGEGPGEQEDRRGEPFVGPAGELLNLYLKAVGLRREECYIANIVKCRPPGNRDPLPEEQEACLPFLREQVRLIRPKIIVCLGRVAACRLIRPDFRVTREHGQFVEKKGTLMMGTFHPAALLRGPQQKPAALEDFMALRDRLLALPE